MFSHSFSPSYVEHVFAQGIRRWCLLVVLLMADLASGLCLVWDLFLPFRCLDAVPSRFLRLLNLESWGPPFPFERIVKGEQAGPGAS